MKAKIEYRWSIDRKWAPMDWLSTASTISQAVEYYRRGCRNTLSSDARLIWALPNLWKLGPFTKSPYFVELRFREPDRFLLAILKAQFNAKQQQLTEAIKEITCQPH